MHSDKKRLNVKKLEKINHVNSKKREREANGSSNKDKKKMLVETFSQDTFSAGRSYCPV